MFDFFYLFQWLFPVMFLLVFGMFIVTLLRGLKTWHTNNNSPRLTVRADVVTKRQSTSHHSHPAAGDASGAHGFHNSSHTTYYVTFQVESGDRMEFAVTGREYGMLAEGDRGQLHFQGTRYLGFDRDITAQ